MLLCGWDLSHTRHNALLLRKAALTARRLGKHTLTRFVKSLPNPHSLTALGSTRFSSQKHFLSVHPASTHIRCCDREHGQRPAGWKVVTFGPDQYYRYPASPSVAETRLLKLSNVQWVSMSKVRLSTVLRDPILTCHCNSVHRKKRQ